MFSVLVIRLLSFFFSSIRRHTRYWRDWSSDVCSSDLPSANPHIARSANSSARSRSAADALRSSRLIELTFFDRRSKKGGFRLLSLACFFYLLHPNTPPLKPRPATSEDRCY